MNARPSPAVYRRRRLIAALIALGTLGLGGWGITSAATAIAAPLPQARVELTVPETDLGPAVAIDYPDVGASAFGASGFDELLGSSGEQTAAPIASITKVITALVILEARPIAAGEDGPVVTFDANDVDIRARVIAENGSNAPVSAGLTLTQRQALTAMLLPSANNYAISLARWAYGTDDAFVAAARNWLAGKGLTDTTIVEPTGLSPLNTSTPANLVELGELALANPVVADIVDDPVADIPGVGVLKNTNTLLGSAGIVGIKTGTTDEAGSCLLFASEFTVGSTPVVLVGVVLGGSSHESVDVDVLALISSAQSGFREMTIGGTTEPVGTASVPWGKRTDLNAGTSATLLQFSDIPLTRSVSVARSVGAAGDTVATLLVQSGSQRIEIPLVAVQALPEPGVWWRLTHPERTATG
ncbi:MAG TPA: D-alanyl-D-alanine carboxypeptidase [Microbacteriaceae bacterium]|nr:D-alanyl-D-alanine carboxypeptidase [Microbacteriaceae bacterium]